MEKDLIDLDEIPGEDRENLEKLMLLVSPAERTDVQPRRLLLFRLRLDGISKTRDYLVQRTRASERCGFSGRIFDYLKDDTEERSCTNRNGAGAETA